MTDPSPLPTPPSAAELLARAGWLDVLDDIHGGLCHDLNSRVASVDGLIQLLGMDRSDVTETLGYLGPESAKLGSTAERFGLLSGRVDAPPEAFEPGDLVGRAAALLGRHRVLGDVDVRVQLPGGLAPVRGSRPRLLRVLLLLFWRAGAQVHEAGAGELVVDADEVDGTVRLRVRPARGPAGPGAGWGAAALGERARPLAELLALDGGTLVVDDLWVGFALPALGPR